MTTKAPSAVKLFPEDSLEKKVYSIVEKFKDNIPEPNERNRLAFALLGYLKGEGDKPFITVKENKLNLKNITNEELANKLENELAGIKS